MPFVNESSERELNANAPRHEPVESSSFGEVFAASVGLVFDEELSISSLLNREGFSQREQAVKESADAGDINLNDYSKRGIIDYNRIASDHADLNIKTNEQLHQERNDLLAQRRNYAEDVIERGSGTAQFLGAATGYMLDPVNVLSMGIAVPYTASKAVSVIGRAALAGKNAAVITGATELGIQALVFQHKQSIDSPYGAGDALANIAMAATGAAALGATAGGLSAWIESVLKVADDLPQTKDVTASKQYLARFKENLKGAPEADTPEAQLQSDLDYLDFLNQKAEESARASKEYNQYLDRIENEVPDTPEVHAVTYERKPAVRKVGAPVDPEADDLFLAMAKRGGLNTKELLSDGFDAADIKASAKVGFGLSAFKKNGRSLDDMAESLVEDGYLAKRDVNKLSEMIDNQLRGEKQFSSLNSDSLVLANKQLSDEIELYDQAMLDDPEYKALNEALEKEAFVEFYKNEVIQSGTLNEFREDITDEQINQIFGNTKSKTGRNQAEGSPSSETGHSKTPREQDVIQRQGIAEDYENDLKAFNTIENPTAFVDGEAVDAKALIQQFDDELDGIESVLRCAYG